MEERVECGIRALIEGVRLGDDDAFAKLVEQYMPLINALISALKPRAVEYDEAFSEACFSLHRAAKSFHLEQSEVTFGLFAFSSSVKYPRPIGPPIGGITYPPRFVCFSLRLAQCTLCRITSTLRALVPSHLL